MASRTQRTRQRNATRRKNRKLARDPLLAMLGVTQARADEMLAEAIHAAEQPSAMLAMVPKTYAPMCCGAKMRAEPRDAWSCLGCGREMTGIEAANQARFATVDARSSLPASEAEIGRLNTAIQADLRAFSSPFFWVKPGRYGDRDGGPGTITFAEDE